MLSLFIEYLNLFILQADEARWLGIKFYDEDLIELIIRLFFNIIISLSIIRFAYLHFNRTDSDAQKNQYAFSLIVVNVIVFFICYLLSSLKLGIGVAFTFFALFTMLRYRTITIPMKQMAYLFIVIAIAMINALATKKVSYAELLFSNFFITGFVYGVEWFMSRKEILRSGTIRYEKINHIKPEDYDILLQELRERTGFDIVRFEITRHDFTRDVCRIKIFYRSPYDNMKSEQIP